MFVKSVKISFIAVEEKWMILVEAILCRDGFVLD